jgi:hypothetical protein
MATSSTGSAEDTPKHRSTTLALKSGYPTNVFDQAGKHDFSGRALTMISTRIPDLGILKPNGFSHTEHALQVNGAKPLLPMI